MAKDYKVPKLILICIIRVVLVRWRYSKEMNSNNIGILVKSFGLQRTLPNVNNEEPCTFRLISDHLRVHRKFTTSGKWIGHSHSQILSNTTSGYYDPEICQ